jgi:hypothetical protein
MCPDDAKDKNPESVQPSEEATDETQRELTEQELAAERFCDHGPGELASNWSVTDKDGNPVEIPTED